MALGVTQLAVYRGVDGADFKTIAVTGDGAYPAGGYAITPALFNFNAFETNGYGSGLPPVTGYIWQLGATNTGTTANLIAQTNPTTGNLQFFVSSTGAEAGSAAVTSAFGAVLGAFGH